MSDTFFNIFYLLAANAIILLFATLQQLKSGNKNAAILLAGLVILSITVIQSVLVAIGFFTKDFYSYIHWGVFILLIALSLILIRQYTELQSKMALNKADMYIAHKIQQSIVPSRPPVIDNISIASIYLPAEIVGGDFFDYVIINDHEIGIIIADITGHGVSAALIAAMFKIAFHSLSDCYAKPSELLERINTLLFKKTANQLLSAFYIYINTSTQTLTASSAGHPNCILADRLSGHCMEIQTKGKIIGAFDKLNCFDSIQKLQPNARIILYTDGLIESTNTARELYGEKNFIDAIRQTTPLLPQEACSSIIEDIQSWSGRHRLPEDDMTLIVIDIFAKT